MEANEQNPPRGSTWFEFVPKQPPRRRQRGALPRLDEQQHDVAMPFISKHPPTSQVRVSASTATTTSQHEYAPDDQRNALLPPSQQHVASPMHPVQETSLQLPQPGAHMPKRQKTAHKPRDFARGAVSFSRSWHRDSTQEQPNQRSPLMPAVGYTYKPGQRGTALAPHDQSFQAPSLPLSGPPLSQGFANAPSPLLAQNSRTLYPFVETKAAFEEMWHQLEVAIQCREGMLMNMTAEMEKCVSLVKTAKADAVKEKEEAAGRKVAAIENLENINKQTGRIKDVREGLEQISTDLSVQVAELNLLLQQAQEQQRVLELLESLKEHYDASENESRDHMDKNLQECEVKLATMEKELECSKRTSELLEKAALKKIGTLEEIETRSMLSSFHIITNIGQNPSKMQPPNRPRLNENKELLEHAVLKLPKLEPV